MPINALAEKARALLVERFGGSVIETPTYVPDSRQWEIRGANPGQVEAVAGELRRLFPLTHDGKAIPLSEPIADKISRIRSSEFTPGIRVVVLGRGAQSDPARLLLKLHHREKLGLLPAK